MDKRQAGVCFCAISAFLFGCHFLAAALYGSGSVNWSFGLFQYMLVCIGPLLPILGFLSLATGIIYLLAAEELLKKIRVKASKTND